MRLNDVDRLTLLQTEIRQREGGLREARHALKEGIDNLYEQTEIPEIVYQMLMSAKSITDKRNILNKYWNPNLAELNMFPSLKLFHKSMVSLGQFKGGISV